MRKHKKLMILIVLVAITAVMSAFSMHPFESMKNDYSGKSEAEISKALAKKSISDIVQEINTISSYNTDLSNLILHASALAERVDEISEEALLSFIGDDTNSVNLRIIMIQLIKYKNSDVDKTLLKKLLVSNDTDSTIKQNIVLALSENDPETIELLKQVSEQEDELLAFQAIKQLNRIEPGIASDIADELLKNYTKEQPEKVRAAIKVKAEQLRKDASKDNEKSKFIQILIDLFNGSNDELMKDTVVFALSDLRDETAISIIVANKDIDRSIKMYCIDQNYSTLLKMVESNPTDTNIETVIQAMNIYPITDLISPLKAVADKAAPSGKASFSKLIEQEGNPVNKKWLDQK